MKKFLKNPWTLGIGTTVIGGIALSFILDWVKGVDWLSTLKAVGSCVLNAIISFLNFELKVWWILIAVALFFLALVFIAKYYDAKTKNEKPSFLSYTKDSVLGYTWEWEYSKGYDGKYTIENLHLICPECGMILKHEGSYGYQLECLRCNKTFIFQNVSRSDAQMLIEDNIKKNYLKNQ